jgi:hypothetical protein
LGTLFRSWWGVPVGAAGWALIVLVAGDIALWEVPFVMAIGGANAGIGVLIHSGFAHVLRRAAAPRTV